MPTPASNRKIGISTSVKSSYLAIGALLLTLTSACGSDGTSAKSVCGGLSDDAAHALKELTGESNFKEAEKMDREELAREVARTGEEQTLCSVWPPSGKGRKLVRVLFLKVDELPHLSDPSPILVPGVGIRAFSSGQFSELYFRCSGEIYIGRLKIPNTKDMNYSKNQMLVLQDLSRKVAQDMNCPNNGGIPKV